MADGPWLVVGLGNPGAQYAATRHNVGAMTVATLVERSRENFSGAGRLRAEVATLRIADVRVVAAVPRSYMNESGGPVKALCDYYSIEPAHLVVVHDELDIDFGALRVKCGGGDGGHNGLRSIRKALGNGDYTRIRVGIGRPPGTQDPADFVLKPFSAAERKELDTVLSEAADAVESVIVHGLEPTQNRVHGPRH